MIKFTPPPKAKTSWILWAVIGSCLLHGFLFAAGNQYAEQKEHTKYNTSRIEFTATPTNPEPTPAPEPELAPKPEPESDPKPERSPVERSPKSNTHKEVPSQKDPPVPIFGATEDSVGKADSSVTIRVGNTLDKNMEKSAPTQIVAPLVPTTKKSVPPPPIKQEAPIKPVPIYNLTKAPAFKNKIAPNYPNVARQAELEGVVQLEVLIDATGRVRHIKVLQTPGGGLEKAAISALTKSRFKPGMVGNKPVPVKIKIPYRFILDS